MITLDKLHTYETRLPRIVFPIDSVDSICAKISEMGFTNWAKLGKTSAALLNRTFYSSSIRHYMYLTSPGSGTESEDLKGELQSMDFEERMLIQARAADILGARYQWTNNPIAIGFSEDEGELIEKDYMNSAVNLEDQNPECGRAMFEDLPLILSYSALAYVLDNGMSASALDYFKSRYFGTVVYLLKLEKHSLETHITSKLNRFVLSFLSRKAGETLSDFALRYERSFGEDKTKELREVLEFDFEHRVRRGLGLEKLDRVTPMRRALSALASKAAKSKVA